MKNMILFLATLCFCSVLASGVEAQQRKNQTTPQREASQPQQTTKEKVATAAQEPEPQYEGRPMSYYLNELKTKEGCWSHVQVGLSEIGKPAVPPLIEVLRDKSANKKLRQCAALVLSITMRKSPDPRAIPALVETLQEEIADPSADLYRDVILSLGHALSGEREAALRDARGGVARMQKYQNLVPVLLNCLRAVLQNPKLNSRGEYNDNNTAAALADLGPLVIKPLTRVALDANEIPIVRVWVITALGYLGTEGIDARPSLRLLINNPNELPIVRGEAEVALRSIEKKGKQ